MLRTYTLRMYSIARKLPFRHYGCTMDLAGRGKKVGRFLLTDSDQPYMNEINGLAQMAGSDDLVYLFMPCQERATK